MTEKFLADRTGDAVAVSKTETRSAALPSSYSFHHVPRSTDAGCVCVCVRVRVCVVCVCVFDSL